MRSLLRAGVLTLVASLGSGVMGAPVAAQESGAVDAALKSRVERRFRVLQVRDGLVLTPRREVRGAAVDRDPRRRHCRRRHAHDGRAVARATRRRRRPGAAGLVPVGRRAGRLGRAPPPPPPPPPPAPDSAESGDAERRKATPADEPPSNIHWRKSSAKVHIGSSIVVGEDELVTDPVVAVGGSVTVLGRVDDDVVAVGGSVRLGPKARVRGDVTAVGGSVEQEKGAIDRRHGQRSADRAAVQLQALALSSTACGSTAGMSSATASVCSAP